ncbi:MAG: alpha/beta hydrolase [Cyanobacteria bacterium P01_A01_bin.37]
MQEYTLIIHGWSDCSDSFVQLKEFLIDQRIGNVDSILYADFESREDSITFNDVIDGFNDALKTRQLIDRDGKKLVNLNVIVHSTGGLVIRHWLWRYYGDRPQDCPVQRIIMLAPANYGSPLAHRGKSFLGRLVRGRWRVGDLFEVGTRLLDGLELASPYQWELAHRDVLVDQPVYRPDLIQLTILIGLEDYAGIRGWVNKPGTDGAVVIAGTGVDTIKIVLDFTVREHVSSAPFDWQAIAPPKEFAFGVMKDVNHGTIVDATWDAESPVSQFLVNALTTRNVSDFRAFQQTLKVQTELAYDDNPKDSPYQQFIVHGIDDQGADVLDFTLEFALSRSETNPFLPKRLWSEEEQDLSQNVHRIIADEFHTCGQNASYRRFLVNINQLKSFLRQASDRLNSTIKISVEIFIPAIERGIRYDAKNLRNAILFDSAQENPNLPSFFYENTTTLIELRVNRLNEYVHIDPLSKRQRR